MHFKRLKIIELGNGLKTADDFRQALRKAKCKLGDYGNDILSQPTFSISLEKVNIEIVSVRCRDLGFKSDTRIDEIFSAALTQGLRLCPAEVGPQLRLQYGDQPRDEYIRVAMEPIICSGGIPTVFLVGSDGDGLWLSATFGSTTIRWPIDTLFAFMKQWKN